MRGLASSGSAYPLQIKAKVRFANRREFVDGSSYSAFDTNYNKGEVVMQDLITPTPLMLCLYDKQYLFCNPSSAILNSQNESHAQAQAFIARQ